MTGLVDLTVEAALLGSLVLEPARLVAVRPLIPDAAAFALPAHRAIYRGILIAAERGAIPDPAALQDALVGVPESETVDLALIAEIVDSVATAVNAVPYAKTVRDLWQRREVVRRSILAQTAAQDRTLPLRETVATAVSGLAAAGQAQHHAPTSMAAGLWDVLADLERQATTGDLVGIGTRIPELDRLTHGWKPGELVIVGARPAVGKTSFALDCTLEAADVGPVLFVSLEMTSRQLRARCLARESGVNLWWIRDPQSWGRYATKLTTAAGFLSKLPISFATGAQTPAEIRMLADQYATEIGEPLRLIVVDYLQLMRSGRKASNRNEEIGDISRDLARMAIDLNVPIVALSQFSRDPAKAGRRPTMHDLRDSGAIEQDASLIVLLHADADQPPELQAMRPHTYLTDIAVEKNRHGATGLVVSHHDRGIGRWSAVGESAMAGAA